MFEYPSKVVAQLVMPQLFWAMVGSKNNNPYQGLSN
jgi:hypothetical protein